MAGIVAERIHRALGLGTAAADVATVFELHPAFHPRAYIDWTVALDGDEVRLGVGLASVAVTDLLKTLPAGSYTALAVPLSCFAAQDLAATPTVAQLETAGALDVSIATIRLTETKAGAACPAD